MKQKLFEDECIITTFQFSMATQLTKTVDFEKIDESIQKYTDSICNLRQNIYELSKMKNQYLIYINQFDQEINNIKEIYHRFLFLNQFETPEKDNSLNHHETYLNNKYSFVVNNSANDTNNIEIVNLPFNVSCEKPASKIKVRSIHQKFALQTDGVICSVQYSPDGSMFAFSDGNKVNIMSSETGNLKFALNIPTSILRNDLHTRIIRYSDDGKYLASSAMINAIAIYSIDQRKLLGVLEGHNKTVSSFIFMKKSGILISGGYDGKMCFWDYKTLKMIREISHPQNNGSENLTCEHSNENNGYSKCLKRNGAIVALSTDEDETLVAVGFLNGTVGIYESSFQQPMNIFIAHSDYLMSLKIVTKYCMIITTSHDKTVKIWSLKGIATCKHVLAEHEDLVLSECVNENNMLLFTGSKDETIKAWDFEDGKLLFSIQCQNNSIFDIDHHPSQLEFLSCSGDGSVVAWTYEIE